MMLGGSARQPRQPQSTEAHLLAARLGVNGWHVDVILTNVPASTTMAEVEVKARKRVMEDGWFNDSSRSVRWGGFGGNITVAVPVAVPVVLDEVEE